MDRASHAHMEHLDSDLMEEPFQVYILYTNITHTVEQRVTYIQFVVAAQILSGFFSITAILTSNTK